MRSENENGGLDFNESRSLPLLCDEEEEEEEEEEDDDDDGPWLGP